MVGASEAEPFWTELLRSLNRRGLRGVKLVISDSHEGIKAASAKTLKATWQRCRVHFMRNALAYTNKTQRRMVSAAIGTVFVQETAEAARTQWRSVADQFRDKLPKLSAMMNDAEHDVLIFMGFAPSPKGVRFIRKPTVTAPSRSSMKAAASLHRNGVKSQLNR